MQNMNLHYMENARHEKGQKIHTLENDRKHTHWKMIESRHPGIWQNMLTWKMHNMENDRKYTHWKMIENTHTGK